MWNFEFANKEFLYALVIIPVLILFYIFRHNKQDPDIQVSNLKGFGNFPVPFRLILKHLLFGLKLTGIALLIVALARPQSVDSWSETTTEGIDISICLDISTSMKAMDFNPNRLEAAKDVAAEFINGRPEDRFALVAFAGESFTVCPLTSDRGIAVKQLGNLEFGMIEDGTAIGMGLATGVNRLKDSEAVSKVVILLTDGVNNRGTIGPSTAADIAAEYEIRVYTVGVGTQGTARYPVETQFGTRIAQMPVEIDEEVLQDIAEKTGGQYFRATDNKKLALIYEEIDQLEKTILDTQDYSKREEEYFPFLLAGLLLVFLDFLMSLTFVKTLP
ncbi:MAG: vWA domain-containing protein [Bacteroidota bacterium]